MQSSSSSVPANPGQPEPAIPSQTLSNSSTPGASWHPTAGTPQNAAEHGSVRRPDMLPLRNSSEVMLRTGAEQLCQRQPAQKTVRSIANTVRSAHLQCVDVASRMRPSFRGKA